MKLDPILTKATRLARRGNYNGAIKTLEPEVNRYYGSFRYYYLLGTSCLYTGDFGGALTYFKLARDIKMRDPSVLLGLAALYLRRGETGRAVDFYLEVQELDEHNRIAKKALRIIRKHARLENLSLWLESGGLSRLYPPLPALPLTWRRIGIPLAAILVSLLISGGILFKLRILPLPFRDTEREGLATSALAQEERNAPVQIGGSYQYILTRDEVLRIYGEARTFFTQRRDEAAKVALNRILESNASEPVKNKARLLISYMDPPGFDTLQDRFTYGQVIKEPALYRDCYVIWRGMATNLDTQQNKTTLDFLVGYDTRSTLEGIVPVVFDFSVPVNPERPLEILGRVVPVLAANASGQDIRLEGVALHQAGFLGNGKP
ncbi:MAG: tetratricopeptide repeat protein [Treponema sp.]|jgi:tetratricopeptide (TPR) repeat protein|nr:tetratricopeptide repeat protein [Treponema sp.]